MSTIGYAPSSMLTPLSKFHAIQSPGRDPTKQAREYNDLQLSLKSVVGSTTNSVNAFDALPDTFVCCAGSAAVLSLADDHLRITQRLFRARPNVLPINTTPSFYNSATQPSTPGNSRHGSPLKGEMYNGLQDHPPGSPSQRRANNRSREISCVALSRRGNLMALGETGHSPRVLIFSTASDSPPDVPLSILSDHSFGISSVAFSDDSSWLCTLGNQYDGFILIYSINAKTGSAKLYSSNKCSNVHRVTWIGHSVVSIGMRHVKVWRIPVSPSKTRLELDDHGIGAPESPTPKAFAGRNCLLGLLMDATFTSVTAISDCRAILCTAQGDICFLDDSNRTQRLERVAQVDFGILCVVFDHTSRLVWIGGRQGTTRSMHLDTLIKPIIPITPRDRTSLFSSAIVEVVPDIMAIGLLHGRIITLDSHRIIEIRGVSDTERASEEDSGSKRLPAHESAVLGVFSLLPKSRTDGPDFLTFSARGTILFWLLDGTCTGSTKIHLDQPVYPEDGDTNDLKIVVPLGSDEQLLSGDTMGILRLIDRSADKQAAVRAHCGDISKALFRVISSYSKMLHKSPDLLQEKITHFTSVLLNFYSAIQLQMLTPNVLDGIAVANIDGLTIVATCGRDRTLQLFRKYDSHLHLLQTLDDHAAAVSNVKFLDKTILLSVSSDRTIIVRKIVHGNEQSMIALLPIRVITLKASPVSVTAVPAEPNVVLVSTLDKQILKFNVTSGRILHSFKASDPTSGDSVTMSSLEVHELDDLATTSRIIIGVSPTDRSIRIHEYGSGAMLIREYGQNAVSAIKLLRSSVDGEPPRNYLVSCGLDGTVMTWDLSFNPPKPSESRGTSLGPELTSRQTSPSAQPPRRILSKAKLSDFQKSLASEGDTVTPIRGSSPSRVRHKISRHNLAAAPKIAAPALSCPVGASLSPANGKVARQSSQDHLPTSQKNTLNSRSKSNSLENQQRSKSAANLNDLNDLGTQMCISLRTFRNRITSSSVAKLEHGTLQELGRELNLTIRALDDYGSSNDVGCEVIGGDVLDVYLAKMIDERLALKAESKESTFVDGPQTKEKGLEVLLDADAAEQEEALRLGQ